MKILIISGFLGSGKTTFINKLMNLRPDKYVVLENEYADVNVDADLLENDREKIWEMTEGCVCCSMNKDMAETVLTISNTYDANVLVIEPTGVGKLSQIIKRIKKVEYEKIEVLPALSLVDASTFLKNMKERDPNYLDQILFANTILLTKTDDMRIEAAMGMVKKLEKLNPKAKVLISNDIDADENFYNNLLMDNFSNFDFDLENISDENTEFEQVAFSDLKEDSLDRFLLKINLLLRGIFGEILRIKGFLPINEQWTKVDSVGLKYKLETIEKKDISKLVVIGKDLKIDYIEDMFCKDKFP